MDEHAIAKDALEAKLQAAKPLTEAKAIEVASLCLDAQKFGQFKAWMENNGASLVRRINGN